MPRFPIILKHNIPEPFNKKKKKLIKENLFMKWISLQMYSQTVTVKRMESQLLTLSKLVLTCD